MNIVDINHETYKQLFRMKGDLTCIHGELLVLGSLRLGQPVVIYEDGFFQSLVNRKAEEKCLKKGLGLFSNKERYSKYRDEFYKNISEGGKTVEKYKTVPAKIEKNEWLDILQELARHWHNYGLTEFSFHDLAYQKMTETGDPTLQHNLNDLSILKVEGRKLLNEYVFKEGVLPNVLRSISRMFLTNEDDAFYLYSDEIADLYDGKNIPSEIITLRRKQYGLRILNDELTKLSDNETTTLASIFLRFEKMTKITGTPTTRGIVKGRVIIAPMLIDMNVINKIVNRMQEGDILVAQSTTPELMSLCKKAAAIVTDQGGMLSHAAVVSRELNIPCIVGTETASEVLTDGQIVEVDAEAGIVRALN